MFGRFLELAIATTDIAASVQFYERLGFTQRSTNDAWPHHYGVLGDGRIHLGLHEVSMPSPSLHFVLPELARARTRLEASGFEPELARLGEEGLHHLRLRDPGGQAVTLLEARTFSPAGSETGEESLCGYFQHLSLPQADAGRAQTFWERAGFVALSELEQPYPHLPLTSDALDLAFHGRRLIDAPLLVFEVADLARQRQLLAARQVPLSAELPRTMPAERCCLIKAPEGTLICLLAADG